MIDILQIKNKYNDNDTGEIFKELDQDSKGELQFNLFIQALVEKSKQNERFADFYLSAINFFLTPSEQIVETIKKAISRLTIYKEETKLIKELEWVIHTLSEKDLFDFRIKDEYFDKEKLEDCDYLKFLSEYSSDKLKREKDRDLELINISNNLNSKS
jgi:hypothetical protein